MRRDSGYYQSTLEERSASINTKRTSPTPTVNLRSRLSIHPSTPVSRHSWSVMCRSWASMLLPRFRQVRYFGTRETGRGEVISLVKRDECGIAISDNVEVAAVQMQVRAIPGAGGLFIQPSGFILGDNSEWLQYKCKCGRYLVLGGYLYNLAASYLGNIDQHNIATAFYRDNSEWLQYKCKCGRYLVLRGYLYNLAASYLGTIDQHNIATAFYRYAVLL
ncbi:hypothetical protein J6590_019016 [Homalodisca vitripennis]|nr:hypothetical protein J6590_019016 [Homalodisca vitripennis]